MFIKEHILQQCDDDSWLLAVKTNSKLIVIDQISAYEVIKLKKIYNDDQINKYLNHRFRLIEKRLAKE